MSLLRNVSWKEVAIGYLAMSAILFFAIFYAAFNNHYPVQHIPAVVGNSNWPDQWFVHISPALAFKYSWGIFRVLGIIIWLGFGLFMLLLANDGIGNKEGTFGGFVAKSPIVSCIIVMVLSGFLLFAGHSKLAAGNYTVPIPNERYQVIKSNPDSLKALFPKDEVY